MRIALGDIALNVEQAGSGPPLLLLHGFTGSAATWQPLLPELARVRRTLAVDLIGHGLSDSPVDPDRYRMERCVEDLCRLLDALRVERTDVLGYSMGGRVALQLAAFAPERIDALVLESASPGLATQTEREARIASDEALAESIGRDGLEAFVDRWQDQPLFASQASLPAEVRAAQRAQRLQSSPVGLANSLRGMGTGRQSSLWDRLPELRMRTLLVAGELDGKYREIARAMAAAMPAATASIIPGAGHTVHLEQPAAFLRVVLEFLEQSSRGER